jgi:copper chaperone
MKTEFIVSDMTCNHCVQTITQAVRAVSPQAEVHVDLASHRVVIDSDADGATLLAAIRDADYDAQPA